MKGIPPSSLREKHCDFWKEIQEIVSLKYFETIFIILLLRLKILCVCKCVCVCVCVCVYWKEQCYNVMFAEFKTGKNDDSQKIIPETL